MCLPRVFSLNATHPYRELGSFAPWFARSRLRQCSPPVPSENLSNTQVTISEAPTQTPKVEPRTSSNLEFTSAIRSLFQDSNGNYWLGSDKEGVARFDGQSFTYISVEDGLPSPKVYSIQEAVKGHLWFSTSTGIAAYDGTRITAHSSESEVAQANLAPNAWAKSVNDLWFGAGNNAGAHRYDGKDLTYLAFPTGLLPSSSDSVPWVTDLAKGHRGNISLPTEMD